MKKTSVVIIVLVLVAGCSGFDSKPNISPSSSTHTTTFSDTESLQNPNPLGTQIAVIAINDTTNSTNNFEFAASRAISYWNNHTEEYGKYSVKFKLKPNATNPDVILQYSKEIDCPNPDFAGCAPIPPKGYRFNETPVVRIQYDKQANWRWDRNNVIHEIGHLLGLQHSDPPYWVMVPASGGIEKPVRNVSEAKLAWRDPQLTVYLNTSALNESRSKTALAKTRRVLKYYNRGANGTRPKDLSFSLVNSSYKADITIHFGYKGKSGLNRWGRNLDQDTSLEYFIRGEMYISESDFPTLSWYVGRFLAYFTRPHSPPTEFSDGGVS